MNSPKTLQDYFMARLASMDVPIHHANEIIKRMMKTPQEKSKWSSSVDTVPSFDLTELWRRVKIQALAYVLENEPTATWGIHFMPTMEQVDAIIGLNKKPALERKQAMIRAQIAHERYVTNKQKIKEKAA